MPTERATPDIPTEALTISPAKSQQALNLEMPATTSRAKETDSLLLRMPAWLKPLVRDAADAEGLSMNLWVSRMLAEAVKRGEASQPYATEARPKTPSTDDVVKSIKERILAPVPQSMTTYDPADIPEF